MKPGRRRRDGDWRGRSVRAGYVDTLLDIASLHHPSRRSRHGHRVRDAWDMTKGGPAPLIVTLEADANSQSRFDAARERWFPPERNLIPAHVTLLHQLPGDRTDGALRLWRYVGGLWEPEGRFAFVGASDAG